MAPRLKVFCWSDGFHAFTVAASSRPKALEAWGVRQDLFATGLARQINDGSDHDAALETPGTVIERGLKVEVGKTRKRATGARKAQADRARQEKIARLEADLEALDEAQAAEAHALDAELEVLEERRRLLDADHKDRRAALLAKLKKARA